LRASYKKQGFRANTQIYSKRWKDYSNSSCCDAVFTPLSFYSTLQDSRIFRNEKQAFRNRSFETKSAFRNEFLLQSTLDFVTPPGRVSLNRVWLYLYFCNASLRGHVGGKILGRGHSVEVFVSITQLELQIGWFWCHFIRLIETHIML
jgi:hypothetical protein